MKIKPIPSYILLLFTFLITFTSCEDRLDLSDYEIPDGSGDMTAVISFSDLAATSIGGSRSSGTAIETINELFVAVYNTEGEYMKSVYLAPNYTPSGVEKVQWDLTAGKEEYPDDAIPDDEDSNKDWADNEVTHKTPRVSFTLKDIPFGRYRMYVAANVGNLATTHGSEIKTEEGLKSISFDWNPNNVGANNQMFGYFTDMEKQSSEGFEAPILMFTPTNRAIHAWIRRLASKVTVAYDGSGLHQGIFVYIHNVSIRQIPLSCALGIPNEPGEGEVTDAYFGKSLPAEERNQVLYYNNKGITETATAYDPDGDKYKNWLTVAKGSGTLGSDHKYNSQALYFYENMQGDWTDEPNPEIKKWFNKHQDPDSVGTGLGTGLPEDELGKDDYRDNVPYGTFIEVEAYYRCDTIPISFGKIRYRFMLGQDTEYNYNAARNHHYQVTLGFNGYANQPDWHIEYKVDPPVIYASEVYIPYSYNTSVEYPITIVGDISELTAEIIENNWAPYDETDKTYQVAPATSGSTNFADRTLEFEWWRDVYINASGYNSSTFNPLTQNFTTFSNSSTNYVYGRHRSPYYQLNEDGKEIKDEAHRYFVTPIWAGFLRLQVPDQYNDESTPMPAAIIRNLSFAGFAAQYGGVSGTGTNRRDGRAVLNQFRNYYYGSGFTPMSGDDDIKNTTDLHKRVFKAADLTDGVHGTGRNSYKVIRTVDKEGDVSTTLILKFWTQPKSMCGISGFSGNNPYEDYYRKAVIRFTAKFGDGTEERAEDVTVLQSKRITNPKGVWRAHENPDKSKNKPDPFNVILYHRIHEGSRNQFEPMISQGEWKATIKTVSKGAEGFISLQAGPNSTGGGNVVTGNTLSAVNFTINFTENIASNVSKCAIVEITYHGNTCVHNIFVRQGYNQPIKVIDDGPYWSSYNVYSSDGAFEEQTTVNGVLAHNPLLFGAYFKRGNYRQAIAVSNISDNVAAFGPLSPPGNNAFKLTGTTTNASWKDIAGNTDHSWHWANFKISGKPYRVPTIADFQTLLDPRADFGIGVLYGDGATAPASTTASAFGFMDKNNTNNVLSSPDGMRGFICYNSSNAHQIFFPVGTTGMGRRTIQAYSNASMPVADRGTLRYGSVERNFNLWGQDNNSLRPIPMNMKNAPGSVYWTYTGVATTQGEYYMGWDMNYFDLNFNGLTNTAISKTENGGGGDAIPIRLVTDTE